MKFIPADSGTIYKVDKLIQDLKFTDQTEKVIKGLNPKAGAWISLNPTLGAKDDDVTDYRAFLIEADECPLEEQYKLLSQLKVPYRTLTYSAKKSLHAIVWMKGITNMRRLMSL